jgi:Holliday junction resolvase RusA-like endonuclease
VSVKFTILGEACSKANSRQIVNFGERPAVIKSKKARDYERDAQRQIPQSARVMFTGPVRVTLRIFYASERPDLDESVVLDVLQAKFAKGTRELVRAGVYANDRQVREKHVYHAIDKRNPRAEIEVEEIVPTLFANTNADGAVQLHWRPSAAQLVRDIRGRPSLEKFAQSPDPF